MSEVVQFVNSGSSLLCDRVTAFLLQSTAIVVAATAVVRLIRNTSPTARYWLWQIVALKLLLMPWFLVHVEAPEWATSKPLASFDSQSAVPERLLIDPAVHSSIESSEKENPHIESPGDNSYVPVVFSPSQMTWQSWLTAFWILAVLFQVTRIVIQRLVLNRVLRRCDQIAIDELPMIESCAKKMGLSFVPEVLVTRLIASPFVCGLFHHRLVLPALILETATATQKQQIVLHELAHVRRRDLQWCWLPQAMKLAYCFHPAAHWVAYQIQLEQELACDQLAIQHSRSTVGEYAETLIDVADRSTQPFVAQHALSAKLIRGNE